MSALPSNNTDELSYWFRDICQTVRDKVAPIKIRQPNIKSEPWLNDETRAVRRECPKAERKWKKDCLQVSFQNLCHCWKLYQSTVKETKRKYFADIIWANCHKPRVTYKSIESVLSAPQPSCFEATFEKSERFLHFFIDKFTSARTNIVLPASDPSAPPTCCHVFRQFEPISMSQLEDVVSYLKPAGSPHDAVPPYLLKEVFPSVGSAIFL